jgi:hypothetical protein
MATYKVANAARMNVVGYIEWQNNKKYDDLLKILESHKYIIDAHSYWVMVENFGLSFAILDRKRNGEHLYLSLHIEPTPDLEQ